MSELNLDHLCTSAKGSSAFLLSHIVRRLSVIKFVHCCTYVVKMSKTSAFAYFAFQDLLISILDLAVFH